MITDRIGLHSVLLPLRIERQHKQTNMGNYEHFWGSREQLKKISGSREHELKTFLGTRGFINWEQGIKSKKIKGTCTPPWEGLKDKVKHQNKNLVLSNELIKVNLPPWKIWKADVSSVSPSSERIERIEVKTYSALSKNFKSKTKILKCCRVRSSVWGLVCNWYRGFKVEISANITRAWWPDTSIIFGKMVRLLGWR